MSKDLRSRYGTSGLSLSEADAQIYSSPDAPPQNQGRTAAQLFAQRAQQAGGTVRDGQIVVGGLTFTPTGLQGETTPEGWREAGHILQRLDASLQWLIGDFVAMGERMGYGDGVSIAADFGFAPGTVYDYAYVARAVEFSVRTENLTFGHHKLVAAMSPDEQRHWLNEAVTNGWSVAQMRQAIKGNHLPEKAESTDPFRSAMKRYGYLNKLLSKPGQLSAADRRRMMAERDELRQWANDLLRWLDDINR